MGQFEEEAHETASIEKTNNIPHPALFEIMWVAPTLLPLSDVSDK